MKYSISIFLLCISLAISNHVMSQKNNTGRYQRIARIVVDSTQLESYKAALKAGMADAVRLEPGVLSLSAVSEKDHPDRIIIFEIYADEAAYKAHIQTAHFLMYKNAVQHMVKSLELIDVVPVAMEQKH